MMEDVHLTFHPLIPAKAGNQVFYDPAPDLTKKAWVPAVAGMSGELL